MAQERGDAGGQAEGRHPSDTESLIGETATSDRLTDSARVQPGEAAERRADGAESAGSGAAGHAGARARVPTDDTSDREAELGHS